jgi:hypothetical protein
MFIYCTLVCIPPPNGKVMEKSIIFVKKLDGLFFSLSCGIVGSKHEPKKVVAVVKVVCKKSLYSAHMVTSYSCFSE